MYVKIGLAKRFSRFVFFYFSLLASSLVCDGVDAPTGVGKGKTKIRLEGGMGGVNGTVIDQYIKV